MEKFGRRAFWVLGLTLTWTPSLFSQKNAESISSIEAKIVKARNLSSQYVVLASKSFKETSPVYIEAFKLYATAYSDYGAWNAYVTSSLRQGKKKSLFNNPEYEKIADTASQSSISFVNYVDENTKIQSKAVITVLSSLADLGLKLWTGISDKVTKDRNTAATNFLNDTQWQTWDDIVHGKPPAVTSVQDTSPDQGKAKATVK